MGEVRVANLTEFAHPRLKVVELQGQFGEHELEVGSCKSEHVSRGPMRCHTHLDKAPIAGAEHDHRDDQGGHDRIRTPRVERYLPADEHHKREESKGDKNEERGVGSSLLTHRSLRSSHPPNKNMLNKTPIMLVEAT
jgi:cytosine/adenosine deaminase-related metal-dependent hydrolase